MSPSAEGARVLISAANLRVGGGVQVAASLIDEFAKLGADEAAAARYPWLRNATFEVSTEVRSNLAGSSADWMDLRTSSRRWSSAATWAPVRQKPYDLEFVVFGPRYGARRGTRTVVGIADGTSVYPYPDGVPRPAFAARGRVVIRGAVSRGLFAREDVLVSESDSLAAEFCRRTRFSPKDIRIIPNAINRSVLDPDLRSSLSSDPRVSLGPDELLFVYVGRGYAHKNHQFLAPLHRALLGLGIKIRVAVTLSEDEWNAQSPQMRAVCINVGVVPVAQLAALYESADLVIFPSLLESFSATPLEALAANGLLAASERAFVQEVCQSHATYFDPLDADAAALVIRDLIHDAPRKERLREQAREFALAWPDAAERASRTAAVLDEVLRE